MNHHCIVILSLLILPAFCRGDTATSPNLNIPRPDRAEVVSVAPGDSDGPKAELSAAKARKVLKLMQGFKWFGPAGSCDKFQYAIIFYAKNQVVARTALCFNCGCFVSLDADLHPAHDARSFDLDNANAKALAAYLPKFFPVSK